MWKNAFPSQVFVRPNWLPRLSAPTHEFDFTPPSYAKIRAIIKRMKSKGSARPLDQLSIIPFKKSAYLRSYITEIIQAAWKWGQIPDTWPSQSRLKAVSNLIHKKSRLMILKISTYYPGNKCHSKYLHQQYGMPCTSFYEKTMKLKV